MWIFGYGSLVWRPAMPFAERRPGTIRGWARRFWQLSPDHRGVPEAPGRVVTLIEDAGAVCWGVAYRIADGDIDAVLDALDAREQAGYERHTERCALASGGEVDALVYVARRDNANYTGERPLHEIAAVARASVGPSGANREYVLQLADALRELGADDPHVFALAELVR